MKYISYKYITHTTMQFRLRRFADLMFLVIFQKNMRFTSRLFMESVLIIILLFTFRVPNCCDVLYYYSKMLNLVIQ